MDVAEAIAGIARAHGIVLVPEQAVRSVSMETSVPWRVAAVPLGPFPARLRLDVEQGVVWHDVIAAEVVPPVDVEGAVEGVAFPRPEVRIMLGQARWLVALSYPLPFGRLTADEVLGLLGAGALYATALAQQLAGHLGSRWRTELEAFGFSSDGGFGHDPRDLLRSGAPREWPDLVPED
jgi:hypothetical protein